VVPTNNLRREAHGRHFGTFTMHRTSDLENDLASDEPGHFRNVDDDWAAHDAGHLALDRKRRQLPDDPAFISHRDSLGRSVVDLLPEVVLGSGSITNRDTVGKPLEFANSINS